MPLKHTTRLNTQSSPVHKLKILNKSANICNISLHLFNFPGILTNGTLEVDPLSSTPRRFNGQRAKGRILTVRQHLPVTLYIHTATLTGHQRCSMWFYLHLGCFHLYMILPRPFVGICFHKFAAIWRSPTSRANAHIYWHLWLAMCEICQRRAEPFGPRLQIVSQWCAHQAAAQARCGVHGNNSEEQYQQSRSNKLPSQETQAPGSIKLSFYAPFRATSRLWHQSLQQFQPLILGYRCYIHPSLP